MMRGLMDKLGVRCSRIVELDFTQTTPEHFTFDDDSQEIDVLFLDPSCSGEFLTFNALAVHAIFSGS